jgi:hypothetical protein
LVSTPVVLSLVSTSMALASTKKSVLRKHKLVLVLVVSYIPNDHVVANFYTRPDMWIVEYYTIQYDPS